MRLTGRDVVACLLVVMIVAGLRLWQLPYIGMGGVISTAATAKIPLVCRQRLSSAHSETRALLRHVPVFAGLDYKRHLPEFGFLVTAAETLLASTKGACIQFDSHGCTEAVQHFVNAAAAPAILGYRVLGPGVSPRLERLIWQAGGFLRPSAPWSPRSGGIRKVLHVGTVYIEHGGHGKWVNSFIERDVGVRNHSLFLTLRGDAGSGVGRRLDGIRNGGEHAFPSYFTKHSLRLECAASSSHRDCAQRVRDAASEFDMVILSVHMFDVVGLMAFGTGYNGPPVVMLEHKDETFYVGGSVLDMRMNGRSAGLAHARNLGGIPTYSNLNLVAKAPPITRTEARKRLSLSPEQVLLVSIGSWPKFASMLIPMAVAEILRKHPDAIYHMVGPPEIQVLDIKKLAQHMNLMERLKAEIGSSDQDLVNSLHAGADIYIDPLMTGVLSAFESGLSGAVILSFCPWHQQRRTLCTEASDYVDPKIGVTADDTAWLTCSSMEDFSTALGALVSDASLRSNYGQRTQRLLRHVATGPGWDQRVEQFYQWAAKQLRVPRDKEPAWLADESMFRTE